MIWWANRIYFYSIIVVQHTLHLVATSSHPFQVRSMTAENWLLTLATASQKSPREFSSSSLKWYKGVLTTIYLLPSNLFKIVFISDEISMIIYLSKTTGVWSKVNGLDLAWTSLKPFSKAVMNGFCTLSFSVNTKNVTSALIQFDIKRFKKNKTVFLIKFLEHCIMKTSSISMLLIIKVFFTSSYEKYCLLPIK